jgi:hypothetical protein
MTTVVRIKRANGEIVQDCDVYIGRACNMGGWSLRGSKWANPFSIKACPGGIDECLHKYEQHVRSHPELMASLDELTPQYYGKTTLVLGCWCKPNKCHGDVLLKLLSERSTNNSS